MADSDGPRLVGDGPVEASTCLDLTLRPLVIWDVNRYYSALGVSPRATRKRLREAYVARGGDRDERLTYILKVLLNPVLRRHYDSLGLGEIFIDRYVVDMVRRAKVLQASLAAQQGVHVDVDSEVRKAFGLPLQRDETVGAETLDEDVQKVEASSDPPGEAPSLRPWGYAYYLWRTTSVDTSNLAEWQELLVSELGRRGEVIRIAVGWHDRHPSQFMIGTVGYRTVVFLHRGEQPTVALAQRAGDRVVQHLADLRRERATV